MFSGFSPVHYAAYYGQDTALELLLQTTVRQHVPDTAGSYQGVRIRFHTETGSIRIQKTGYNTRKDLNQANDPH